VMNVKLKITDFVIGYNPCDSTYGLKSLDIEC